MAIKKKLTGLHTDVVRHLRFAPPDGNRLLSVGQDYNHTIGIWDTATGQLLAHTRGGEAKVFDIQWAPNGGGGSFVQVGFQHIKFHVLRGRNVDTEMGIFGDEKDVPFTTMMCVGFVKGDCAVAGGTDGSLFKFEGRNLDVVAPEAHLNGECVGGCVLVPCTCVLSPCSVLSPFFGVSFGHVTFFRCFIWTCVVTFFRCFILGMSPFFGVSFGHVFVTFFHVPLGHVFVTFSVFHLDRCLSPFLCSIWTCVVTFSMLSPFFDVSYGQVFVTFFYVPFGPVFVTFSLFHLVYHLLTNDIVLFKVE